MKRGGNGHVGIIEVSLTDSTLFRSDLITSNDQLTDISLLGLATKRGGQLVTFDRRIPISVVIGASSETLQVLAPSD